MTQQGRDDRSGLTPMMRQYYQLKDRCPEGILFFRMGDFYEVFGEEAEEIAPRLEITLTSRERGDQQKIPFCGVPHHSAKGYWHRLLKMGYKVAIADQVEDASQAKGLVKRDIIKVMSPGCIDELEGLDQECPNYVIAVLEDPESKSWSLALGDVSTGELRIGLSADLKELQEWVELYRPKELLCRRFCRAGLEKVFSAYQLRQGLLFSALPEGILRDEAGQKKLLKQVFGSGDLKKQPSGPVPGGIGVLAALLSYFEQNHVGTGQFLKVLPIQDQDTFVLGETAVRDLELFETSRSRSSKGSLFQTINHCMSPMGARSLRRSLANPYRCPKKIQERHETVSELIATGEAFMSEVRLRLKGMGDIERLGARVVGGRIRPQELARLRDSLSRADALAGLFEKSTCRSKLLWKKLQGLREAGEVREILNHALLDDPASAPGDGDGIFKKGFDSELDKFNEFSRNGEEKADAYLSALREETGISSLKIKQHKTFGMVLEVTKSNLSKVPPHFIRRQTMVNCERFVTEELKDLDDTLSSANDQAVDKEQELYQGLLLKLLDFKKQLVKVSDSVANMDVFQSFAWLAIVKDFTRSTMISHSDALILDGVRHPVVEESVGKHQFVPNDIVMGPIQKQLLITGPNMAGKSTMMRQIALCAVLNQAGGVVPARSAKLPVFDGIFTRVGASDDLSKGLSTFMVEMSEAAYILRNASAESLVILDEVGRGTSTEDGLAIASAILGFISNKLLCWTLFATHYHELVHYSESLESVRTVQTEVLEKSDGITFTHRLIDGASGCSYGLEVAQLAGIPEDVIESAKRFLQTQTHSESPGKPKKESSRTQKPRSSGRELFKASDLIPISPSKDSEIAVLTEKLETIKIELTTPIQALNILYDLKSILEKRGSRDRFQDGQT